MRPLLLVLAAVAIACSSSSLKPVDAAARLNTDGTYRLTRINNCEPPCLVMIIPPEDFWIQGGRIVLGAGNTFIDSLFGRVTSVFPLPNGTDQYDTTAMTGTWWFNGVDALSFEPSEGADYWFTVSGNVLERTVNRSYGPSLRLRYEFEGGQEDWTPAIVTLRVP